MRRQIERVLSSPIFRLITPERAEALFSTKRFKKRGSGRMSKMSIRDVLKFASEIRLYDDGDVIMLGPGGDKLEAILSETPDDQSILANALLTEKWKMGSAHQFEDQVKVLLKHEDLRERLFVLLDQHHHIMSDGVTEADLVRDKAWTLDLVHQALQSSGPHIASLVALIGKAQNERSVY